MSVRKRSWITAAGEQKCAWVVDFNDLGGKRRLGTFRLKKQADRYETKVRAERLDAELEAKGPAEAATSPDHGPINPAKEIEMNVQSNSTAVDNVPPPSNPADDVNRAKAVVLTVWLALQSPDLSGGCEGDIGAIGDCLYEAYLKLRNAERNLGVHS